MLKVTTREISQDDKIYQQVLQLRNTILMKPRGIDLFNEDLSSEKEEIILIAENEESGDFLGCILLKPLEDEPTTFKIRQFVVKPNLQGSGIGKLLIQTAEAYAKANGRPRLCVHARATVKGFYQKLGYKMTSDEFEEGGILHIAFEKLL